METTSRRSFISSVGAAAGAAAIGTGCTQPGAPAGPRIHPLEGAGREELKITDVTVTLLSFELPEDHQWMSSRYVTWKTDSVLLQIFTDQGIVGIGEPSPYGGPEAIKEYVETSIKPAILGKNPFDVEQLTDVWAGSNRAQWVAWAGVDCARWDIIGKATGKPVYEMLATDGPPATHIRMYASGGVEYAWYDRPEDLIEEAVRYKERGYTAFKFRIGTDWEAAGMTVSKYVPYLEKMRAAVGPDFDLMQEANKRWSLEECLEICPVLEELKVLWFEEPIKTNDIVQPDTNTTGITRAWHVARLAHRNGKPCCPHNWHGGLTTMANAALVAAIPNHLVLELNQTLNPFKEEIFVDPLVVNNGYMDLPSKPGFGVEVIPDAEKKYPYIPGRYNKPNPKL